MPHPSRILVVEDYEPFRRFVCALVQTRPDWQVIAVASDGLQAVQKAEELKPDLILLDIGLPVLNGLEAAKRISTRAPGCRVLFVTQQNDDDIVATALNNGARGYVLKVNAGGELLPAIGAVLDGRHFVGAGVSRTRVDASY